MQKNRTKALNFPNLDTGTFPAKLNVMNTLLVVILSAGTGFHPMPLHPDFAAELRVSGELEQVVQTWKQFNVEQSVLSAAPAPVAPIKYGSGIAILVDFVDNKADTANHPPAKYDTLLFSTGVWKTGSMKDFYIENSYGLFNFSGKVAPPPAKGRSWYRVAGSYDFWSEYYGFAHSQELANAAVAAADPDIDFSQFDNDGPDGIPDSGDDDGVVDAVYVVHAGPGYEEGHCGKIWSHMSGTYYETQDNAHNGGKIRVERYSIQPEEKCNGNLITMGVFSHEYGHILGLPDLYDYDYDAAGVGRWSLMAGGSWNGDGASPAHMDAWSKSRLGWIQPERITSYKLRAEFPAVENSPVAYRLWTNGDTTLHQYFLVENRQKMGLFDSRLPGEGIIVYHVDEFRPNNDDQYIPEVHSWLHHYKVAVEQADGKFDLERNSNNGDQGDAFPGTSVRREIAGFLPYPTTRDYTEEDTKVAVLGVSDSEDTMYADLDVGRNLPYFRLVSTRQFGSNEGRIKPGEQGSLVVTLSNLWGVGTNVEMEIDIPHEDITVTKSKSTIGRVEEDETVSNMSDPFYIALSSGTTGYVEVQAQLTLRETTTGFEQHFTVPLTFGWPGLLLVNDSKDNALTGLYEETLDNLGVAYEATNSEDLAALRGLLLAEGIRDSVLIWFTGQETSTLNDEEESLLSDFLASGGKLIISSQNLGEDRSSSSFYMNVLRARFLTSSKDDIMIYGTEGNPIILPEERVIVSVSYGTSKDGIEAQDGTLEILAYPDGEAAALIFENDTCQHAYLAFPLEGLTGNPNMVITKDELTARLLTWFGYNLGINEPQAPFALSFSIITLTPIVSGGRSALIEFYVPTTRNVDLFLCDASGRLVSRIQPELFQAGKTSLAIPTGELSRGVYFVGVKAGAISRTASFVVIN